MSSLSQEGKAIAQMFFKALDGEHTVRGCIGRIFRASLQIRGEQKDLRVSLRLVLQDAETGRTFGCARTIIVPVAKLNDPLTVVASLEQEAFMATRKSSATRSSVGGNRESFHRPFSARRSH